MTGVSTLSAINALRAAMQRTQVDLGRAREEAGSGRVADPGLALGVGVARSINLRNALSLNDGYGAANAATGARLEATQTALASLAGIGDKLRDDVLSALNISTPGVATAAANALAGAIATLNTRAGGQFLFAGVDVDKAPLVSAAASGAGRTSVEQVFTAAFGVAPGAPGASAITPAAMQAFLDNQFAAQFDPSGWTANWSQASDTQLSADIAPGQRVRASATANEDGARKLVQGAAALAYLGVDAMSPETRRVVLDHAAGALGDAAKGLTETRARLGIVQRDTTFANDALKAQTAYVEAQIGQIENVDPAEVAMRISMLTTQLETTYSLTARARQMSLVSYL